MFNLHSKASEKLNTLEEINDDIDDYESELSHLKQWMDDTRSHLTMRDTTLTLKEQLAIQEVSITQLNLSKEQLAIQEVSITQLNLSTFNLLGTNFCVQN